LEISVPTILNSPLVIVTGDELETSNTEPKESQEFEVASSKIEEEDLNNLTIPAILTQSEVLDLEYSDSETNSSIKEQKHININTMAQNPSSHEFIADATRLIPAFDGQAKHLASFIDALERVDGLKGEHESLAISIIKTKLKGYARDLIDNEKTIPEVISRLQGTVKGDTVAVLSAKLMNIQHHNKNATQYTVEVEQMAQALQNAYKKDGLSYEVAREYSTNLAVKAMIKNCPIDKVRVIMQAGNFKTMAEAIAKYIDTSEANGQSNNVLFYNNRPHRGGNRGRENYRGNFRGYNNNYNNQYSNNQNNGGRGNYRGNSRGRGNRGHNNNNNVRVTQNNSGNSQQPSDIQQ